MDIGSFRDNPASWLVAGINVAWFLFVQAHGDTRQTDTLLRFGALERSRVWKEGESWRLLTACFLHIGWIHLIWNTYFMFGLCQFVELQLGTVRFILAYLLTGIAGSAVSLLGHRVVSAGASGAGFGMIGVQLAIYYRMLGGWNEFFSNPGIQQALTITAVWFVLGLFAIRMDNFAHGGGLLFGVLAGYALSIPPDEPRIPMIAGVVVFWIVVVLASLNPRFARKGKEPDPPYGDQPG